MINNDQEKKLEIHRDSYFEMSARLTVQLQAARSDEGNKICILTIVLNILLYKYGIVT